MKQHENKNLPLFLYDFRQSLDTADFMSRLDFTGIFSPMVRINRLGRLSVLRVAAICHVDLVVSSMKVPYEFSPLALRTKSQGTELVRRGAFE